MTSAINYTSINENFPVAGQDNDTQVFRDNFDTIKTNFREAYNEITDLQDFTAKINTDNDFEKNVITRAIFQNCRDQKFDGEIYGVDLTVDYENGSYQIFRFSDSVNVEFLNLPGDPILTDEATPKGLGKITLELYSDGSERTITFRTTGGTVFKKNSDAGWTGDSITLNSLENPVFIEVWRHSQEIIFMKYVGQFS